MPGGSGVSMEATVSYPQVEQFVKPRGSVTLSQLESMESGITGSSHWSSVTPIHRVSVTPFVSLGSISSQITLPGIKTGQISGSISSQIRTPITLQQQITGSISMPVQVTIPSSSKVLGTSQHSLLSQRTGQKLFQQQIQHQFLIPKQKLMQTSAVVTSLVTPQISIIVPTITITPPPPIIKPPPPPTEYIPPSPPPPVIHGLLNVGGFEPDLLLFTGKKRKKGDFSRWRIHPVEMDWKLVEDIF